MKDFRLVKKEKEFEKNYGISIDSFKNNYGKYLSHFYFLKLLVSDFVKVYEKKLGEVNNQEEKRIFSACLELLKNNEKLMNKYGLMYCRYVKDEHLSALGKTLYLNYDFINTVKMFQEFLTVYDIKDTRELEEMYSFPQFEQDRHERLDDTIKVIRPGEYRDRYRNYLSSLNNMNDMFDDYSTVNSNGNNIGGMKL